MSRSKHIIDKGNFILERRDQVDFFSERKKVSTCPICSTEFRGISGTFSSSCVKHLAGAYCSEQCFNGRHGDHGYTGPLPWMPPKGLTSP